ncbi:MAG: AI-2E family transporter [Clostridia bacterium]|nr:AI-2E family transporter [Clostridia bacterium]
MHNDPSGKEGKKKIQLSRRWVIFGTVYLLAMLAVILIVNSRHLVDFINLNLAAFRPVIIGLVIAYVSNPLYNFLHDNIFTWTKRAQVPRKILSMVCTYAVVILFLIVFVMLLLPQLSSSIQDLSSNLEHYVNQTLAYVNELVEKLHLPFEVPTLNLDTLLNMLPGDETLTGVQKLTALLDNVATVATTYVADVIGLVLDIFIALFIAGYTLASKQRISAQIRRILTALFREKGCGEILGFVRDASNTFGQYVVGKLIDSTLVIVLCSAIFSLARIPYAILIGFIVGATNIIPFFGPIFGAIPCGLLVFITEPRKLITFIILVLVVQQVDANIIDPLITGNATGLSSLGVIVAVTVMGNYFGVMGMILGVPVTVSLLSLGKRFLDRKLTADDMPTDLEPYYPPKTEEVDMGTGEHVPLFTKLVHYVQDRRELAQERKKIKEEKKAGSATRRALTEDDVGMDCPETKRFDDEDDHKKQP